MHSYLEATTSGLSISSEITCKVPKVSEIVLRSNSFSSFRFPDFFSGLHLTFCQPVSSAENLYKQFERRSSLSNPVSKIETKIVICYSRDST